MGEAHHLTTTGGIRSVTNFAKVVRIWSFSGLHFPVFGLNTEKYGVSPRIQSECGKIQTRKTPNTETFHAVTTSYCSKICIFHLVYL